MSVTIVSRPNHRCDVTKGVLFKKYGEVFLAPYTDEFTKETQVVFVIRINKEMIGYCTRYDHAVEMLLREMNILEGTIQV